MAKQTRAWEFDLDEGLLDAARLLPPRRHDHRR
jgi:cobalamin biosynthesis protein CobT